MKKKSTLAFCTFFLTCCFSLIVNAQQKKANNDFSINLVKYSDKPNFEKEHFHVFELKNNSMLTSEYSISLITNKCSDNKLSSVNDKSINIKESNINTEVYFKDLNRQHKISDIISLKPNESVKLQMKTQQKNNAKLDSWNCTTICATEVSNNKSKDKKPKISKSIIIKTFIPNPNNLGH